jgi:hypothetical protein
MKVRVIEEKRMPPLKKLFRYVQKAATYIHTRQLTLCLRTKHLCLRMPSKADRRTRLAVFTLIDGKGTINTAWVTVASPCALTDIRRRLERDLDLDRLEAPSKG